MKRLSVLIVLTTFLLTGCVNKSNDVAYDSYSGSTETYEIGANEESQISSEIVLEDTADKELLSINNGIENKRKIINKADLSIETVEFDNGINEINNIVKKFNGFIEASNITQEGVNHNYKSNRYCEFVIRVPQENFENILNECGEIGLVTNKRLYGEDISSQYYDTETRLKVLKAQEERYLEILSKAETVEEIIQIEKALTEIRYEIESLTGYIKQMDDLVDYSTINLYLYEVNEESKIINEPKTFGEKVINTFNNSIEALKVFAVNFILAIIAIIPFALIAVVILVVILFIIRFFNKRRKNRIDKK